MGAIETEVQGSAEGKASRELVAVVQHWPDEGSVLMWLAERNPATRAESADEFLKSMGPAATHFSWGSKIELFAYDEEMPEGLSPTKLGLEMDQGGWSRQVRSLARSLAKEGVSLKLATAATVDGVETLKEYAVEDFPKLPDAPTKEAEFEVVGTIWAGDPCYDRASEWEKVEAASGTWKARALLRQDGDFFGNGMMPARFEAWLEGAAPAGPGSEEIAEVGVDSARLCFRVDGPPAGEKFGDLYDEKIGDSAVFAGREGGAVALTFYGDGSYPLFAKRDAEGKVVALTFVTDPFDPDFFPGARAEAQAEREQAEALRKEAAERAPKSPARKLGRRDDDLISFGGGPSERPMAARRAKKLGKRF